MRKMKNIALLLAAAAVITACAILPEIVAACQDGKTLGQNRYEPIANIQLDIRGEEETPAMGRLAMISRMDGSLEISKSMASMTQEEAEARFYQIMQQYIDAGLAESFDSLVYECRCMLASVTSDPTLNGVYWMITLISGDDSRFAQFDAAIDDETGNLLAVSYATDRPISAAEREKQLSIFSLLYFESLGIPDYGDFATNDLRKQAENQNYCAVRYRFGDLVYGEVNVDLYVNTYGFYTEFPDLGGKTP